MLVAVAFTTISTNLFAQKDEFKPSGKLWGYTFGDFYYKLGADSLYNSNPIKKWGDTEFAKVKKDFIGVNIRRLYLGYDYNIASNYTAHILLESSDGILTPGGDRTVLIKAANLEWKNILKRHTLTIGLSGTPCYSISEKIWGYRSIEKTIGNARKILLANDIGIKLEGSIDTAKNFGYTLMYGTGRESKPEDNRLKKYYAGIEAKFFNKQLLIAVNFDYEDQSVEFQEQPMSKMSMEGFLGFSNSLFTIGLEGVSQIKKNYKIFDPKVVDTASTLPKDSTDVTVMGISFFVRSTLIKDKLAAFARYDVFNPDIGYQKGDNTENPYKETFTTVGIDFTPNKNVHIIPNIWFNSYTDIREKPANYAVATDWTSYYKRKPDVVARLTFYYVFK